MQSTARIKVDKDIKPLKDLKSWKLFKVIVGEKYYVSFQTGYAVPCKLVEVYQEGHRTRLLIGYKNPSYNGTYTLFQEELGRTAEEAAIIKFGLF
ncbi:MAG: hypothetical protein GXO46_16570 [Chlorobi bacterium]|uniref:hypothetical protein n=1 Tax=Sphingobacterium multivorum TaxID=28454 RepID=UPI002450F002|nr:hypothetical protein [Sphingobacterium multivorum]NPA10589.1 hypothetical protein [Chlorobiota bacterium]